WVNAHTHWGEEAVEWRDSGEDPSFLLSGAELESAEGWLARQSGKRPEPTPLQNRFVLESRRRATRRLRQTRGAVSAALLVAVALAVLALIARSSAISNQHTAQSRQLAAEAAGTESTDPELSALLALDALRIRRTREAELALRSAVPDLHLLQTLHTVGEQGVVRSAAFSPGGGRIVTSGDDGTVRIWNTATGREVTVLRGHSGIVQHADFSPDGRRIVTAGADGTARVWSVATGRGLTAIRAGSGLNSVAVSPNGRRIVTAGADGTVRVWDVATGRQLTRQPSHPGGA